MCPADITDTTTYARVAQLVEHDLAKVGAAGSSPVSRSLLTKRTSGGCPFFVKSSPAGPGRSRSTLRSGRRRADVHWTSCAVSRSPSRSRHLSFFAPLRSLPNSVHRTLASSLRSGRRSAIESLGNFWLINHWSKKFSLIQTRQIQRWIQTYLFRFSCHSVTYIILAR